MSAVLTATATATASAVAEALPERAGRPPGNAIRLPTPDVSLAVLSRQFASDVGRDALNAVFRRASVASPLHRQIDYVESPGIVSSDILASRHAGVIEGSATIAPGGRTAVVCAW